MKKLMLAALAAGLLVAADKPKENTKKELKKFQGNWAPVAIQKNDTKVPEESLGNLRMMVKGNKVTIKEGDKKLKGTFTIDAAKNPKWLDATVTINGKEEKTMGIYKFEKGKLTVCYTHAKGKRPKTFSTKGGTQEAPIFLAVYKRADD
jgi:uncharacterized protein (TIGR03067 family)